MGKLGLKLALPFFPMLTYRKPSPLAPAYSPDVGVPDNGVLYLGELEGVEEDVDMRSGRAVEEHSLGVR